MPRLVYESYALPPDQSFMIKSELLEIGKHSTLKAHAHFEIALLDNCVGKRFIGDHIRDFSGPELVLLGSYLPHCWKYEQTLNPALQSQAIVIHFFPDFLGRQLLEKPEARQLNSLFRKAVNGVLFYGDTIIQARQVMQQMLSETGIARAALMLQLLGVLAESRSLNVLSSPYFNGTGNTRDTRDLKNVFDYILCHFKEEILLKDVANLMSMSPPAFCRFFKRLTNRTMFDFIKEVRIGHAARLLLEGNHNVSEVCYESGYNNISHFNKHFKEIKGLSPRGFVKQYGENENIACMEFQLE